MLRTRGWLPAFLLLHLVSSRPELQAQGQAATPGTQVARAVSGDVLRAHLEFLSDDALEGRATATRGGALAAKYIAAQFRRLGLQPAGDSGTFYHRVLIIGLTPAPSLRTLGAAPTTLRYRDDYVLWSMRDEPSVSTRAEAVFVGYGIVAPEYRWNDYRGVDVKDKIVICLVNDPGLRDSTIFKGKILTYYGRWTYKLEEAARHGAAGVLLIHSAESATYPWSTVRSSWTGEQVRLERPATSLVVAGWLDQDAAAGLFRSAGADLPALERAAVDPDFTPRALGLELEAQVASEVRRSGTFNVVGRLPGHGAAANDAVLIGGHYDHFGVRSPVDGDSIYNGAEDNASGTAAVLAAAEAFVRSGVRPGRSVLFMAFAAEESGLLGSQAFAERPTLPLRNLAAVLNLDEMNLFGRTRDIAALGLEQSSLGALFSRAARVEGLKATTNLDALLKGEFFRSDHFSFAPVGVPALSLKSGLDYVGHPSGWGQEQWDDYTAKRYHQPSDNLLPSYT
ncbi:MAG: M20/M25/M40 family metallo-hydrolase, partial [Gemmatimonadales bacterium]